MAISFRFAQKAGMVFILMGAVSISTSAYFAVVHRSFWLQLHKQQAISKEEAIALCDLVESSWFGAFPALSILLIVAGVLLVKITGVSKTCFDTKKGDDNVLRVNRNEKSQS